MLSANQVVKYHADGFIRGSPILSDEQIEELRNELDRVIEDQQRQDIPQPLLCRNLSSDPDSPVWQIVNIWQASDAFAALIHHPTITEAAAQLSGASELRIWHDQIQYKPAGTGGVNMWHQDAPYWPILTPQTSQITAWVALDDVDESNGCMSMIPGSHKWGNQIEFLHTLKRFEDMPSSFEGREIQVQLCPVSKGQVHYHHPLTWHGSGANKSNRPRRAIAIHFMTPETCFVAAGDHVLKPFINIPDGEMVRGEHFPIIWHRSR